MTMDSNIEKWIEQEVERLLTDFEYKGSLEDFAKRAFTAGATALYNHLASELSKKEERIKELESKLELEVQGNKELRYAKEYITSQYAKDMIDKNNQIIELQSENKRLREEIDDYWKERCDAAENLIAVMDIPKNRTDSDNEQFKLFADRNHEWQKSKQPRIQTTLSNQDKK